jgi:small subunit ribosomal protein S3
MGQKIHPIGFRVGITRDWESRWFAPKKAYSQQVYQDYKIRSAIKSRWYGAGISRIEIERAASIIKVIIYAARPGQLIGRGGKGIEEITQVVQKELRVGHPEAKVQIDIQDVRSPETDAQLVAENIAQQLEKRISHRRATRQSLTRAQRANVKGIKVMVSGRLGGAEIARVEWDRNGRVPLQTLRADIDYGFATAFTIYGTVGVKVWVYKGDIPRSERRVLLSTITTPEGAGEPRRGGERPGRGDRPARRRRTGEGGPPRNERDRGGERGGRRRSGAVREEAKPITEAKTEAKEETPIVETPVVETPVMETPVAETTFVEETTVAETPAVEETPIVEETSAPETPLAEAETTAAEETPAENEEN